MPTEFIPRYDRFDYSMFNDAMATLETMAFNAGNVLEMVASGTLTADTDSINLSLLGVSWRWLRLRLAIETNLVSGQIQLGSNGAQITTASTLTWRNMATISGAVGQSDFGTDTIVLTGGDTAGIKSFSEMIIMPTAVGFIVSGQYGYYVGGIGITTLFCGVNVNGVPTSLQVYNKQSPARVPASGSRYILEGVRA